MAYTFDEVRPEFDTLADEEEMEEKGWDDKENPDEEDLEEETDSAWEDTEEEK